MHCQLKSVLILLLVLRVPEIMGQQNDKDGKAHPEKICMIVPERGDCNDKHIMWFFNYLTQECETFTYSNCGGNQNRFFTKDECMAFCYADDDRYVKLIRPSLLRAYMAERLSKFPKRRFSNARHGDMRNIDN